MLQPRTYPELIGKTLMLEAEPFVVMAEDDNPWVEGVFFTFCLGVMIGLAHLVGGLLLTAILPNADAVLAALVQGWQQFSPNLGLGLDPTATTATLRQVWAVGSALVGYGGGWFRLFTLVATPFLLMMQWLLTGLLVFAVARTVGGQGTLNQTLGATALMAAPHALSLLTVIPFVTVSQWLLMTWSVLIVYRATEVTHQLPWQRAAWVALAPLGFGLLVALALSFFADLGLKFFMGAMLGWGAPIG